MSAFLVDPEHINVLLWAAHHYRGTGRLTWYFTNPTRIGQVTPDTFGQIGQMLVQANAESVNTRQGPLKAPCTPYEYRYTRPAHTTWSITEVLNALDAYVFQSCDPRSWETSEANAFCTALQTYLVRALPGYNAGPWAITPNSVPLRPRRRV